MRDFDTIVLEALAHEDHLTCSKRAGVCLLDPTHLWIQDPATGELRNPTFPWVAEYADADADVLLPTREQRAALGI